MNWSFLDHLPAGCPLILGIALANNLDNIGVGVALGVGRVRLSAGVNAWISVITFVLTAISVGLGHQVLHVLPAQAARSISAFVLCALGAAVILPALTRSSGEAGSDRSALGRVLRRPERADLDGSRHIDGWEGTLLGVALSLNNLGGGVGAGLLHLSAGWTALCSAALSFGVLAVGGWVGRCVGGELAARRAPLVAGGLLIAVGLLQLR